MAYGVTGMPRASRNGRNRPVRLKQAKRTANFERSSRSTRFITWPSVPPSARTGKNFKRLIGGTALSPTALRGARSGLVDGHHGDGQSRDVIELKVVRHRREERGDGEGQQTRLDPGREIEEVARLRAGGGATLYEVRALDAPEEDQEEEGQARKAEVGRVLQIDVVDVHPGGRQTGLVDRENVHAQPGADDGVCQRVVRRCHLLLVSLICRVVS